MKMMMKMTEMTMTMDRKRGALAPSKGGCEGRGRGFSATAAAEMEHPEGVCVLERSQDGSSRNTKQTNKQKTLAA